MAQYLPIFALLVLALVFGAISRVASKLLSPSRPTAAKSSPYECGITSTSDLPQRFPVTFFIVAMIFIVFDIEVIFLLPWSVVATELGSFGFIAVVVFAVAVFESFVYLIGKGALDWGPVKTSIRLAIVDPARTSETTIRRVGLEGRDETDETDETDTHAPAAHAPHEAA